MTSNFNVFSPDYMSLDFNTAKESLKSKLRLNPIFKDFDFEGSNISTMIELVSYLISLNTYYMNMIAKNSFITTSNMYETTHMLSRLSGYNPFGYRSSKTNVKVSINLTTLNDSVSGGYFNYNGENDNIININEWSLLKNSAGIVTESGNLLTFVVVNRIDEVQVDDLKTAFLMSEPTYNIDLYVREGYVTSLAYTGSNIVDNKIFLPFNPYDHDDNVIDEYDTIKLFVNDTKWNRLNDWYEDVEDMNAYMFKYNKYGQYYIEFSSTRNVPIYSDAIAMYIIVSSGVNGNVGVGIIDAPVSSDFITINGTTLSTDYYTITNEEASSGGSSPDTIEEIKVGAIGSLHSQYRNVTKNDYISHLETKSDIIKASVWGEQDISPSGSVMDYNKVYISVIPNDLSIAAFDRVPAITGVESLTTPVSATMYNTEFTDDVLAFLKPRKIISVYETFVLPELLYFVIYGEIKLKLNYVSTQVSQDVKNKLIYFFSPENRKYGEIISFIELENYILDTSIVSPTDGFTYLKGLNSFMIRDISIDIYDPSGYTSKTINEPTSNLYPKYVESGFDSAVDNKLRGIELGYNQFPLIHATRTSIVSRT